MWNRSSSFFFMESIWLLQAGRVLFTIKASSRVWEGCTGVTKTTVERIMQFFSLSMLFMIIASGMTGK